MTTENTTTEVSTIAQEYAKSVASLTTRSKYNIFGRLVWIYMHSFMDAYKIYSFKNNSLKSLFAQHSYDFLVMQSKEEFEKGLVLIEKIDGDNFFTERKTHGRIKDNFIDRVINELEIKNSNYAGVSYFVSQIAESKEIQSTISILALWASFLSGDWEKCSTNIHYFNVVNSLPLFIEEKWFLENGKPLGELSSNQQLSKIDKLIENKTITNESLIRFKELALKFKDNSINDDEKTELIGFINLDPKAQVVVPITSLETTEDKPVGKSSKSNTSNEVALTENQLKELATLKVEKDSLTKQLDESSVKIDELVEQVNELNQQLVSNQLMVNNIGADDFLKQVSEISISAPVQSAPIPTVELPNPLDIGGDR